MGASVCFNSLFLMWERAGVLKNGKIFHENHVPLALTINMYVFNISFH